MLLSVKKLIKTNLCHILSLTFIVFIDTIYIFYNYNNKKEVIRMRKKHSTKRALLDSVLSLVLCLSMLICSTFAWFTDSVSSTNNIIQSGNLDIEMYRADGSVTVH